jgi:hypothetical protein
MSLFHPPVVHTTLSRARAGYNTSTVALRVVRGDGNGTQCPGEYLGQDLYPGGYKYGDLALQVGESQEFGQQNVVLSAAGLRPERDCAGEAKQQE